MDPSSFAAQFETVMVLEGGTGNRLSEGVSSELATGVMNVLATLGVVPEEAVPVHWAALQRPQVVTDDQVVDVQADRGGVFLPAVQAGATVAAGDLLGTLVEPLSATEIERCCAPVAARVLAVREQPSVHTGSLLARLLTDP
jgi:predicted deacylase